LVDGYSLLGLKFADTIPQLAYLFFNGMESLCKVGLLRSWLPGWVAYEVATTRGIDAPLVSKALQRGLRCHQRYAVLPRKYPAGRQASAVRQLAFFNLGAEVVCDLH
jgi:hypothetical protein